MKSCRAWINTFSEDCLYIHDSNMRRITYNSRSFRCELTINRKSERNANTVQENPAINDGPVGFRRDENLAI